MSSLIINIIKIFTLTALTSALAVIFTPFLTNFLYKHKLWKKAPRRKSIDNKEAPILYELHKEREVSVPRFGGILIWFIPFLIALIFLFLSQLFPQSFWLGKFNFFSRAQTWLPFFALVSAALIGLIDDILQVKGKGEYIAGGLTFWQRFLIVALIGLIGGLWFYFKLDWRTIHIPGGGDLYLGPFYILAFIIVMLACWSGGVIDGLDGLAGGTFASIFTAYGIIAFFREQYDLAAFCGVVTGAILSFLWFNIPPARFYMGETGSLALTSSLCVVAFLTDSILVLPIIAGLLVIEAGSVILQLFFKKFFKRKIFLSTPLHHHLEAKGWPHYKITMRFWTIGIVLAIIGVTIRLLG